jgi:hypothetical protein
MPVNKYTSEIILVGIYSTNSTLFFFFSYIWSDCYEQSLN